MNAPRKTIQSIIDWRILAPVWRLAFALADDAWLRAGGNERRIASEANPNRHPWLEIEVTNHCNANCSFCAYGQQTRAKTVMGRVDYESIIDQYSATGGGRLVLTPFVGDSLMDKKFADKVRYAKSKGNIGPIAFSTNAILLTREKFEELAEAGLGVLEISVSGLDREEYKRVYRVDQFDRVFKNLLDVSTSPRFRLVRNMVNVRSDRLFPQLNKNWWLLKSNGYNLQRNAFYDNWGGAIKAEAMTGWMFLKPARPVRKEPCAYMYGGARVFATGEISACGCRNFNADGDLIVGHVKHGLTTPLRDGSFDRVRSRFGSGLKADLPNTCQSCREYRPSK